MKSEAVYIIQRVLELTETGNEALGYVQNKVAEGNYEAAYSVFVDIVELFGAVEAAIQPFVPEPKLGDMNNDLQDAFDRIITCYENKNYSNLSLLVEGALVPRYDKWYNRIRENLRGFVVV